MAQRERLLVPALVLATVAVGLSWPLSAYALHPAAMPFALTLLGAAVVVLTRPEYGIAIVVAVAPLTNVRIDEQWDPFQILIPLIVGCVIGYGLVTIREREAGPAMRSLSFGALALVAVAALSAAQALDPSASVKKVALTVTAVALFFAVRLICRSRAQLTVVIGGALAGLLIAAIHGLVQKQLGIYSTEGFVAGTDVVGRVYGSFGHPNFYGAYIALLLPLAVAVLVQPRFSTPLRWLALAGLVCGVPALAFSYSRGAIIGLVVGAALWLAVLRPRLAAGVAVATVIGAILFVPATLKERFDPENASSAGDVGLRVDIWNSALAIYSERPVLGIGPNNFALAYERLPSTTLNATQRRLLHNDLLLVPPHPQSIYLQALAEQGIVGLATLLVFSALALSALYRCARRPEPLARAVGIAAGMGFLGVLIHGFFEVPLLSELALPLFAVLAVAAVLADEGRREGSARTA